MNASRGNRLGEKQLAALQSAFHQGSADASQSLAKWIGRPSVVEIDSLDQLPLEEATGTLGVGDEPICFCSAEMQGLLTGELILAFDDASGLALTDMLLEQPAGTTRDWTEMADVRCDGNDEHSRLCLLEFAAGVLSGFRRVARVAAITASVPSRFRRVFARVRPHGASDCR